jgi:hypothetical protein
MSTHGKKLECLRDSSRETPLARLLASDDLSLEDALAIERAFTDASDAADDLADAYEHGEDWRAQAHEFIAAARKAIDVLERVASADRPKEEIRLSA